MSSSLYIPDYPAKAHKSGLARIYLKGREYWLGKWGTPESRARYAKVIAEYAASGLPPAPAGEVEGPETTIAELVDCFRIWAEARYQKHGRQTTEPQSYRAAMGPVIDLYGAMSADQFGPLALGACREELKRRGYCRSKINAHLGRIRRVWKWGVSREMVSAVTWQALTAVEGFRHGEAPERAPVSCVPQDRVDALRDRVLPPVWAMVQLQLWTGMRPGEVVQIRTCDVLCDDPAIPAPLRGKCWLYRPSSHKTEHHDRDRLIFLGPQAREILQPWLKPESPSKYVFSALEAVAHQKAQRKAKATTKNYTDRPPVPLPRRKPRAFYTAESYCRAIHRGCERAYPPPADVAANPEKLAAWRRKYLWSPNRLRHNAATLIRQKYGVEVARIILGHTAIRTTEIYAERDLARAAEVMSQIG